MTSPTNATTGMNDDVCIDRSARRFSFLSQPGAQSWLLIAFACGAAAACSSTPANNGGSSGASTGADASNAGSGGEESSGNPGLSGSPESSGAQGTNDASTSIVDSATSAADSPTQAADSASATDSPTQVADSTTPVTDSATQEADGTTTDAASLALDAAADGATGDGAVSDGTAAPIEDGAIGPSCIGALYSTYVLRADGPLIWESNGTSPQTIVDASTGNPLTGIVNVQEGNNHGCAALSSGAAECWQENNQGNVYGQLGNGTTTATSVLYRATPVLTAAATPLTNVVAIAPGISNTACAVTSDGKLWCWGDLTWIVNKGTANLYTGYAQAITTDGMNALTGVSSASLGYMTACAIVSGSTNSVWCWGGNAWGELAQGDTVARQYPTKVLGLTDPTQVSLSPYFTDSTVCALDGANVRCWGVNYYGATGSNTTTNPIQSPTPVVNQGGVLLGGVANLEAGNTGFAVRRTDNTIWTWGAGTIYASNYGITNVLALGWAGPTNGPRYLTSDGVYHSGMTAVSVNCNAL